MSARRISPFATLVAVALLSAAATATAAPATYEIDPAHTFPSFEADHMGISVWRGKFNRSSGEILLDRAAGTGSVKVVIDTDSIDYGLDAMNEHARNDTLLDTAKFPQATYTGTLADFRDGAPTRVKGELTLHGVTRPVDLTIERFKCIPHPLNKRELCGADARGEFRRDAFGIDAGKDYGFDMNVALRIQVEATRKP
ncbi:MULTISPECIES: YceI family protein [unclassified Lysobacter]|uniref:YceI family protein n=1 Tax=unclassified Lysobacter TaxID=2635362 RepID=UPI001C245CDC|nr:YceI family protein [Lysobacter sp. MMG2]MBU8975230.1 YceI family protein [Lysobacter sp. MMG2]